MQRLKILGMEDLGIITDNHKNKIINDNNAIKRYGTAITFNDIRYFFKPSDFGTGIVKKIAPIAKHTIDNISVVTKCKLSSINIFMLVITIVK